MDFFKRIINALLRFFGLRREEISGAQDAAEMEGGMVEEEVVDREAVGREEAAATSLPAAATGADEDSLDAVGEPDRDGNLTHRPRYLWCLDNGHGKATAGKRSGVFDDGTQLFEYELNRAINRYIMESLDEIGVQYFNVVPEVEGDVSLQTRVDRANDKETDLESKIFVSIHANANGLSGWDAQNVKGIETWFYGGSWRSKKIASAFQRALVEEMAWKDRFLKYRFPYSRSFFVLRKTTMPAVLVENGFYSSKEEAELLRTEAVQKQIAAAYVKAILEIEKGGISSVEDYKRIYKFS